MSFGKLLKVPFREITIKTNNYCNLSCYSCSNLCDIPLRKTNENIFRRRKWEASPNDLIVFCERFRGIGEGDLHMLTGAETTMMPIHKIYEIIDIFSKYSRRLALRTTGFGLLMLDEKHLNKISRIMLGDHGINHECIVECMKYLKTFYNGMIKVEAYNRHLNLWEIVGHPANKGKRCPLWMGNLSLIEDVIYPCCNIPWLMAHENTTRIKDELQKSNWTIYDPEIIYTLSNWRETIPKYVSNKCLNECWAPNHHSIGEWMPITRKKNDKIMRNLSSKEE